MKINKGSRKINILIERFFIVSSLVILISTLFVGLWFNKYEEQQKQEENLYKIHRILSQLIVPSLAISDFSEVKRLLFMASGKEETFLIVDSDKTIIMPDDERSYLSNFIKTSYKDNSCQGLEGSYKLINGKKYLVYCSIMHDTNLDSSNKKVGVLLSFTNYNWLFFSTIIFYFIGILLVLFMLLISLFRKMLYHKIIKPLLTLKDSLLELSMPRILSNPKIDDIRDAPSELIEIKDAFERLLSNFQDEYHKRIAAEKAQTLIDLSKQVAHDIRSPLSAINTALASIKNSIPENIRIMIKNAARRINDIANNILFQSRNTELAIEENDNVFPELIFVAIDNLLSEKRYEHSKTNILFDIAEDSYSCFSEINLASFKRVLSNLINNSIEAIRSDGCIKLSLKNCNKFVEISITDNGCGIPEEILPKITEHGFSYGKESGAGIGLSYSKHYIDKLNGTFTIDSKLNIGTKVKIILSRCDAPEWFCESISIRDSSTVVVLDDDPSIHEAWKERFNYISNLKILDYFNSTEMLSELNKYAEIDLFLIDFELIGSGKNGLEVINQNKLNNKSILVTSCFEDKAVRTKCESLGVKIIPKNYVPNIPILLTSNQKNIYYIFIDDDEMMRLTWTFAAEEAGKHLYTFESPEEFETQIELFDKHTKIFIDSNLGKNIKGEVYAKKLFEFGFTEIYLSTAHPASHFGDLPWIKSIV
jgi:signal transduction histidine kinase